MTDGDNSKTVRNEVSKGIIGSFYEIRAPFALNWSEIKKKYQEYKRVTLLPRIWRVDGTDGVWLDS